MSEGLSERHLTFRKEGNSLNDDSFHSEKVMTQTIREYVLPFLKENIEKMGGNIVHATKYSLYDCQKHFHEVGGPEPDPENNGNFMRPDGGIFFAQFGETKVPLLILEDKRQGTNDSRLEKGLPRQATGNAIERFAKNVRMSEMLFTGDIFPYIIFASGCDFHYTESISKRFEQGNYGYPNKTINVTDINQNNETAIKNMNLDISKKNNKCVATICIKSHKWNELPHNSSAWKVDEMKLVLGPILNQIIRSIKK